MIKSQVYCFFFDTQCNMNFQLVRNSLHFHMQLWSLELLAAWHMQRLSSYISLSALSVVTCKLHGYTVPGALTKSRRAVVGLTPILQQWMRGAHARPRNVWSSSRLQPGGSFLARRRVSSTGSLNIRLGGGCGCNRDTWMVALVSVCRPTLSTLDTAAQKQKHNH